MWVPGLPRAWQGPLASTAVLVGLVQSWSLTSLDLGFLFGQMRIRMAPLTGLLKRLNEIKDWLRQGLPGS